MLSWMEGVGIRHGHTGQDVAQEGEHRVENGKQGVTTRGRVVGMGRQDTAAGLRWPLRRS